MKILNTKAVTLRLYRNRIQQLTNNCGHRTRSGNGQDRTLVAVENRLLLLLYNNGRHGGGVVGAELEQVACLLRQHALWDDNNLRWSVVARLIHCGRHSIKTYSLNQNVWLLRICVFLV
jgi:hypothetical protein